ncbi:MAG: hypothetical protein JNG88_14870 [Phycisphaerales bacterium]|nr:hypothetical protein [Phycisphaerales bacterium]
MSRCPTRIALERYAAALIEDDETRAIAAHIEACAACARAVAALPASVALVGELQQLERSRAVSAGVVDALRTATAASTTGFLRGASGSRGDTEARSLD